MQRVHMDIVGPLPKSKKGNLYILTVQCSFTKWVEAYPLRNQRAVTCASVFVKNWVSRYGVPESIHSDQGRNFESNVFKEMCQLLQMKKTADDCLPSTRQRPGGKFSSYVEGIIEDTARGGSRSMGRTS